MSQSYAAQVLRAAKLSRIYDGIISSKTNEEPSKADLVGRLVRKYGKPAAYLTGKKDADAVKAFKAKRVRVISPSKLESL